MSMTNIFKILADTSQERDIALVLVGGWALNAYGVSRQTLDVDFLIDETDFGALRKALTDHSYQQVYKDHVFAKLRSERADNLDIDLLFVDSSTIDAVVVEGRDLTIEGASFRVPSLLHLVAMKLHALKNNEANRRLRDLPDIMALIEANSLDVADASFKDACLKYGTPELYNKICNSIV